jgi:DNA polymerase (family 10)
VNVVAQGDTKATVISNEGFASTCASFRRSRSATCSSTSRAERSQRRDARGRAPRAARSPSTGITTVETGDVFSSEDEDAVYAFLGYQPIRRSCVRTAASSRPRAAESCRALVELGDLRGDSVTHALVGRRQEHAREMVAAAAARGYEYYAITDHSHYLREDGSRRSSPRSRRCGSSSRAANPPGVEANIRSNGEVDVPEDELAPLDWVVASVHNAPENRPTERVLEAMDNPYVDCIGSISRRRRIRTRGRATSTSGVSIEGARGGLPLEITGSPTGSICATCTRARRRTRA